MKSTSWKDIAELVGIAAIVVSLIFVGLQLKQSQDIVLSELDASINSIDVEITSNISDNSDVWVRGNADAELSDSERAIYNRLVADIRLRYQTSFRRNTRFGREDIAGANVAAFAVFLHANPGAKRTWQSRTDMSAFQKLGFSGTGSAFDRAVRSALDLLAE